MRGERMKFETRNSKLEANSKLEVSTFLFNEFRMVIRELQFEGSKFFFEIVIH